MSISPELIELAKKLAENARARVIEERKRIEAIRQSTLQSQQSKASH